MGVRRSKRVGCKLSSWTTLGDVSYNGFIENISREGILNIIPDSKVLEFFPERRLTINFQASPGLDLSLPCKIIWSRIKTNVPFGLRYSIGMEILKPPSDYIQFVENLYKETVNQPSYAAV